MTNQLNGCSVAILVTDGFEQVEMTEPRKALEQAGAKTTLVSPKNGQVQGWNHDNKGEVFKVDAALDSVDAKQFDALLLPGGVANPDRLRMNPKAVAFVESFVKERKPIAAICHGPWMLVETKAVNGKTVTSWPSLKTDITNAGGKWVDREVVTDGILVTSRKPDDIPAFNQQAIALFAESLKHAPVAR